MTETATTTSSKPADEPKPAKDRVVLEAKNLQKTFVLGFFRKRVEAVRDVSFIVRDGETFGLLGPNGAGKTTSLKMILGLIAPSSGEARLFGKPRSREAMKHIGYMPENPYVYQYLRPLEFLDLCGRLVGMPTELRVKKSKELVERVGLSHAIDREIGKFSKGMTQRIGLAQALMHDPEVLILDEPMSGLDPIGRKEIRDLLDELRRAGKTLVITSHILSDVERLCDHVAIVNRGRVQAAGALHDLLRADVRRTEIDLSAVPESARVEIDKLARTVRHVGDLTTLVVEGDEQVGTILERSLKLGAKVVSVTPHRETLEDLFVRNALKSGD